ncbi:Bifunctional purine biosynthetic protein ade1 [Mycoblastus sanguinarius]|nr:Bifunctional purine biosynthetic protein ade1 [Mycoblastus sanguinarius]
MAPVLQTDLGEHLPLVASGKVREIYKLDESTLLFVATDRISAYDVVLNNGIDRKGAILTQLSEFWFILLQSMIPNIQTHYVSLGIPPSLNEQLPPLVGSQLQGRSMVVRRLKVFPIESIVRGYITGSAWASYKNDGTLCGISLPIGLQESQKLDQPIWTPSTKAERGGNDENISPAKAAEIVGKPYAHQIETLSLEIYQNASAYAAERGIIIADTKFEFGLDEFTTPPSVVLIDEVLTPDSSRFWSAETYAVGRSQESFDKQYLRDWLVRNGLKGKEGIEMPEDIAKNTQSRYREAYQILVGSQFHPALQ